MRALATILAIALVLVALPPVAQAQQPGDLATLLSRQAPVSVDGEASAAWTAVALRDDVLEQSRAELSDLRLFDERDVEVPFVLVGGGAEPSLVTLDRLSIEREGERTHLVVVRPTGLAVERLILRTTTPAFDRLVDVRDVGPGGGGRVVGAARIHRLPGGAERLIIPVSSPRGEAFEVVVADGDSPTLENLVVAAEVERPILVSALAGPGTLRFGGGRLRSPRYDVPRVAVQRALAQPGDDVRWAQLGAARDNPAFDPLPALAFAMKPGASVSMAQFRHRCALTVEASREGLSGLPLSVADRAHARADLGDLRVVDDLGRQRPYLVEETGQRLRAPLTVEEPVRDARNTIHRFGLPGPRVPVSAVELVLSSTFADRPYRLVAGEGDEAITIASGHLRRRPGEDAALVIELGEVEPATALALEVQDGDDAPLSLVAATALVPGAELFVVAPAGRYWLMSGAPDLAAPHYEIERARPMLLSLARERARVGPIESNPAFVPRSSDRPPPILWAVLCLAVAVLGWLTLRAVAEDDPEANDDTPVPDEPLNA